MHAILTAADTPQCTWHVCLLDVLKTLCNSALAPDIQAGREAQWDTAFLDLRNLKRMLCFQVVQG